MNRLIILLDDTKHLFPEFMKACVRSCLLMLIGILPMQAVHAVEPDAWVGPANIEVIVVQPNGRIYVKLMTSTPDLGCPGNTDGWLELNTSYPHFDEQYALLLTAHSSGRQVRVYVGNGCGHYPYAQNVHFF